MWHGKQFFKISFFLVALMTTAMGAFAGDGGQPRGSVVKVFVHSNPPDFFKPWQSVGDEESTGSGVIISDQRILTSAHVISDQTFVQVKKTGDPRKYTAHVVAVAHDADLAILKVENPEFFHEVVPVPLMPEEELPMLQDLVTVLGYPQGGDQLSITEGVVSRIDVTPYSHSGKSLLTIQIDAAINPGNSGGPVIKDGKLVGIAFQGLKEGENIGYIVPTPIIYHFLRDLEDGHYDGFPMLGIITVKAENQQLREALGLKENLGGVLVTAIVPDSPGASVLQEDDVITKMDGIAIASDRTVELRRDERVLFTYLLNRRQLGETLSLEVIREGRLTSLEITLTAFESLVAAPYTFEEPQYYIYGGLVFTVLCEDLLRSWNSSWNPAPIINFNYYYAGPGRLRLKGRQEICVLLNVLPDEVNVGYDGISMQVVDQINGKQVKSFRELAVALHNNATPLTRITTEDKALILLDHQQAMLAQDRILKKHRIPAAYSREVGTWLEPDSVQKTL